MKRKQKRNVDEEAQISEIIGPQLPPDFQFPLAAPPGNTEERIPAGPSNDTPAETGLPERNGVSVEASVSGAPSGVDSQSKATEEGLDSAASTADGVVAQARNVGLVRKFILVIILVIISLSFHVSIS